MSIRSHITGGSSTLVAQVIQHTDHPAGLVTYTHPADHYNYNVKFLANPTYGVNMAINPTTSPTILGIHNGTDTALWTATAVTGGGFVFNSTTVAHTGTRSIDCTVAANNDVASFTTVTPVNPALYESFRGYVYITSFSTGGTKDVTFQFLSGGTPVGNSVSIKPYTNTASFNNWQLFDIPLGDLGLIGVPQIDELRITVVDQGAGAPPDVYLDDLGLVQAGTSNVVAYRYKPELGEFHSLLRLQMLAYNSSRTSANPTEFFGLAALTNGCELILRDPSRVYISLILKDLWDGSSLANSVISTNADGSAGATFSLAFNIPLDHLNLDGNEGTFVEFRVRDNLSGLSRMNISLHLATKVE